MLTRFLLSSKSSKRDLMKFYNVTNRNLLVNSFVLVPKKNSLNKFSYLEKRNINYQEIIFIFQNQFLDA